MQRIGLAVLVGTLAIGCDRLKWEDERLEREADTESLLPSMDKKPEPPPPPPDVRPLDPANLPPLERAKKKLVFPVKGATHLGFNLQALEGVHALAGALEIPDWAVPGDGETRAMRDDDLGDGWQCVPALDRPCAIGMHLATPAQLRAVRIFASAPGKARNEHPRIAKVRLHTDAGWADAELPDDSGHAYVVLGKPVETRTLILEVMSTRGRDKGSIHVADFEVYGTGGIAREPIELDPAKMIVRTDGDDWSKIHDGWAHGDAFLEVLGDDGKTRRVLPGTAIYGHASDRVQLVERLDSTDCRTHRGSYYMLDRITRVLAPVGDLGGLGGQVFRARSGMGFASGYVDEGIARLSGVVLDGEAYKHRRTQRVSDVEGPAVLVSWEMESEQTQRGGAAINQPLPDCALASDDTIAVLAKTGASKAIDKPGEWMICALGGGVRAYLTDHGPCGKSWEIVVLDAKNAVVASKSAKRKGARLRTRRWSGDSLLVEIAGDDDQRELMRVGAKAIASLGKLALAVDPPPACRSRCDDVLRNPTKP